MTRWLVVVGLVASGLMGCGREVESADRVAHVEAPGEAIASDDASDLALRAPWEAARMGGDADATEVPMDPALRAALVQSIQAEADARYAFTSGERVLRAAHPTQDLRVAIEANGVTLADAAGELAVHFSLARLDGRVVRDVAPVADGTRVELAHDRVTEWYAHGALGLEQGFTVDHAPRSGSAIVLELAIDAEGYTREAHDDGTLELSQGSRAIVIRDLYAHDADDRTLPSRMAWVDGALRIEVDAEGARYPVVIDPMWSQQAKLVASDGESGAYAGWSVGVSGDTAVVGARVHGGTGAAYVFIRSGGSWTQQATLTAADGVSADNFGVCVAISGHTIVVGADQDDDAGSNSGSAYVFVRSGTVWTQQAKLVAADAAAGDRFGSSVAVSMDTAVVGAPADSDAGTRSGSAYVFSRSGLSWTQQTKLVASDAAATDEFGTSVSVAGDTAVAGSPYDSSGQGSVYVFVRSGAVWTQQAKLVASDAAGFDLFGAAVSISSDTVVVGAYRDSPAGANSGSAYVFLRVGVAWSEQAKLTATDGSAGDSLGFSVSVSGHFAIIGAYQDDGMGSAYAFTRVGSAWTEEARLVASDRAANDFFGWAVAVSGSTAVVAAIFDDDAGSDSGAAYVFTRSVCGNGAVEAGEDCDGGACCTTACAFAGTATVCRAATTFGCDVAEACDGVSAACPADLAVTPGTACGGTPSGDCDAQDTCAGTVGASATCTPVFAPTTTVCRAATSSGCDVAEACDGASAACPADLAAAPGTTCGGAPSGACDAQDTCTGTVGATATCTPNFAPTTTVCRASTGECDLAESCTGASTSCPATDLAAAPGTTCGGAPSGACDAQDTCAGTVGASATCTANFAPTTTVCRASTGECDLAESCTGASTSCPATDLAAAPGTTCGGAPSGACDAQDTCAGTVGASATCTANFAPTTTVCRASTGECDLAESCTGASTTCPATDLAAAPGTTCGGAPSGDCDAQDTCAGTVGASATCTANFASSSTMCRSASCAAAVETLAASCTGSAADCPTAVTSACAPYLCGAGSCDATCGTDGDCMSGHFCDALSACVSLFSSGAVCARDGQCGSGHCVDGLCCDTGCTGQCEACDVTGSEGTCAAVTGAPHSGRTACTSDGSTCGGSCDGATRASCVYPAAATSCRDGACGGGTATLPASCNGAGSCPAVQTQDCAPFTCGATECDGDCATDDDCTDGAYCSAGVCVPVLDPGAACARTAQCGSGHCVDGLCCDSGCTDQCEACDLPGSEGRCSPITGDPHGARAACASDGTECGGSCDGALTTACSFPDTSDVCGAPSCEDGSATDTGTCDGLGGCTDGASTDCAPFVCGISACLTTCDTSDDCMDGLSCIDTVCTSPDTDAGMPDGDAGVLDAGTSDGGLRDAGVADASTSDAMLGGDVPSEVTGCGCTAPGRSASHPSAWLALIALALIARRRR